MNDLTHVATESRKLLTFEFLGLCLVTFVAFCNITIFYNLFQYLQSLGIAADLRGVVIGAYSLTAMVVYLLVSPFLTPANAHRTIFLGMAVLAVCGLGYLVIHSFWGLLALRMMNGLGQSLMGAGAMTLYVSVIPPEKSGQAFAVYSVAFLLPYGVVPATLDALASFIPTPAEGYAGATLTLLPAAWVVWKIRSRDRKRPNKVEKKGLPAWRDIYDNVAQLPVALILLLNTLYLINWSSLFYLFRGFANEQGITNVGLFFSVQMGFMIVLRLLAGRIFDTVDKAWILAGAFVVITLGHWALDHLPGLWAVPVVALVFGLGLGMGSPSLNGLIFDVSRPHFRALNANLLLCTVQTGFFLGPVLGGGVVVRWGYHGYFIFAMALSLAAILLSVLLVGKGKRGRAF